MSELPEVSKDRCRDSRLYLLTKQSCLGHVLQDGKMHDGGRLCMRHTFNSVELAWRSISWRAVVAEGPWLSPGPVPTKAAPSSASSLPFPSSPRPHRPHPLHALDALRALRPSRPVPALGALRPGPAASSFTSCASQGCGKGLL